MSKKLDNLEKYLGRERGASTARLPPAARLSLKARPPCPFYAQLNPLPLHRVPDGPFLVGPLCWVDFFLAEHLDQLEYLAHGGWCSEAAPLL